MKYPDAKVCPQCRRLLRVILGVTFTRKAGAPDGLQPWCKECDDYHKREPRHGWTSFRRILTTREQELWSEQAYIAMMGDFACKVCGWDVNEWGAGHWVDRIDNNLGHIPGNCRPSCWPCNQLKKDMAPQAFSELMAKMIQEYRPARIPWGTILPRVRHISKTIPPLGEYVVKDRQMPLIPMKDTSGAERSTMRHRRRRPA